MKIKRYIIDMQCKLHENYDGGVCKYPDVVKLEKALKIAKNYLHKISKCYNVAYVEAMLAKEALEKIIKLEVN